MLEDLPLPGASRTDGRRWGHARLVHLETRPDVRRPFGGSDTIGSAVAGNATAPIAGPGGHRFDGHLDCQLHRHYFDGADFRQEAQLRCSAQSGAAGDGLEQYCWRPVFVRAERHFIVALADPGANWRPNTSCQCGVGVPDSDHSPVDRAVFRSSTAGKISIDFHSAITMTI